MNDTLELLLTRRSVKAIEMVEPGPSPDELDLVLRAAARVPDHGKLGPGASFASRATRAAPSVTCWWMPGAPRIRMTRMRAWNSSAAGSLRGPVVVAVISSVLPEHKIPEWEQVLSAGAVCMNMLTAAHASGYVAQWLTEWMAYDAHVGRALGLGADERVAGFIYIGSPLQEPKERVRPDLEERISDWAPASSSKVRPVASARSARAWASLTTLMVRMPIWRSGLQIDAEIVQEQHAVGRSRRGAPARSRRPAARACGRPSTLDSTTRSKRSMTSATAAARPRPSPCPDPSRTSRCWSGRRSGNVPHSSSAATMRGRTSPESRPRTSRPERRDPGRAPRPGRPRRTRRCRCARTRSVPRRCRSDWWR